MDDDSGDDGTDKPPVVIKSKNDPTSAYLGPRNIFSNPITLDDLMDDDSNSGGELVNINDVFENSATTMSPGSPPASPEVMTRPSIIVPVVKSKNLKYFCYET